MKQYVPNANQLLVVNQQKLEPLIDYLSKRPFIEVNKLLQDLLRDLEEFHPHSTEEQGSSLGAAHE